MDKFELNFGMTDDKGDTVRPQTAQFKVKQEGVFRCKSTSFEPYTSKAGNPRAWLSLQVQEEGMEHMFITVNMGLPESEDTSMGARLQLGEIAGFFNSAGIGLDKLKSKKGFTTKSFCDKVVYCHHIPGTKDSYAETKWISESQHKALRPVFAAKPAATGVTVTGAGNNESTDSDPLDGL
tara:strand:- start:4281 stop:4820 length:540 start_codon:yes stop_codon:yes gene_type:complete